MITGEGSAEAKGSGGGRGGGKQAKAALGMREVEAQVRTCQLCRLAKTRTNAVPGEGDSAAEVMLIGEGPGYHEDRQGRPFVGAAGQFLNELLAIAGLTRGSAFVANVVKCRPPGNRDPLPDEIAACAPYLERQIALINPRIIVTLGRYSMSRFFPGEKISQIHGTARVVDGRMCVAMYHPAAGLHQASLADIIRADFRKLPLYMEQARRMFTPEPEQVVERIAEAEAAREFVVHEAQTGAVLEGGPGQVKQAVQEVVADAIAEPTVDPVAPQPEPGTEPQPMPAQAPAANGKQRRSAKPQKKAPEYEQLSFLDM